MQTSGMTLAQYVAHWRPLASTHLKPRTVASYEDTLRLHLLPAFGAMRVRDLQRGKIKAVLAAKLETHKPNSVRIMVELTRSLDRVERLLDSRLAALTGR